MYFIEDIWPLLCLDRLGSKTRLFSESLLRSVTDSMSNTSCQSSDLEVCRDESAALKLKLIAIASILLAGVAGVAIPLIGKHRKFLRTDGSLFVAAKAFAAGVILATGFVHMLAGGNEALTDPCLPEYPWSKFPFSGFFAMVASLVTLLVDFVGTQYYERKQGLARGTTEEQGRVGSLEADSETGIVPVVEGKDWNGKVFGEEEGGGMHIVGMHAHAAHHRHSHPNGQDGCDGLLRSRGHEHERGHGHGHEHGFGGEDDDGGARHVVVSQGESQPPMPLHHSFFSFPTLALPQCCTRTLLSRARPLSPACSCPFMAPTDQTPPSIVLLSFRTLFQPKSCLKKSQRDEFGVGPLHVKDVKFRLNEDQSRSGDSSSSQ